MRVSGAAMFNQGIFPCSQRVFLPLSRHKYSWLCLFRCALLYCLRTSGGTVSSHPWLSHFYSRFPPLLPVVPESGSLWAFSPITLKRSPVTAEREAEERSGLAKEAAAFVPAKFLLNHRWWWWGGSSSAETDPGILPTLGKPPQMARRAGLPSCLRAPLGNCSC